MGQESSPETEALARVSESLQSSRRQSLPSEKELKEFNDKVEEVTRYIEGLKEGTLPPEYVDRKIEEKRKAEGTKETSNQYASKECPGKEDKWDDQLPTEREEELKQRAADLKASYERKQRARAKFEEYVQTAEANRSETDYARWDLWCPSDDEDELISKLTLPSTPEFKAMEKDIDDRHKRQVEARQVAERCRVKGNELYKAGQWAAAYDWYTQGLEHEKSNVALNANAAMASIKMACYVQAIEHADKVQRICDFLLEKPKHPLKVKALQRKAAARTALGHHKDAVSALEEALEADPENTEAAGQLERARAAHEEDLKERRVGRAAEASDEAAASAARVSVSGLRKIEELSGVLRAALGGGGGRLEDAARDLADLLEADDSMRVHFRQCGGLGSLLALVTPAASQAGSLPSGGAALPCTRGDPSPVTPLPVAGHADE
eukprot:CAMPEP_0177589110 /NCGR_PEP_ID=MMETSP0419_2-20121207/6609_1 /TAXON_ID=582737 /ORGANISM="Tetraselmis sp., Strain GSL018" /LENGTH=437 /DNA_ID=CAMNT_0019079403 /DNA_START=128 /DNA_END=1438 /DNA_ORIENTATION=+